MPAEWEPHVATWLSWPRREGISFPDSFDRVMPTLRAMVAALIESEQVCINVCDLRSRSSGARQALRGLRFERISFYKVPTNEPWCRDHGPIFLTRTTDPKLAVVDWDYNAWGNKYPPFDLDEVVPTRIAEILNVPIFCPGMVLEGGSIDVNGSGALLTSESCLLNKNRNPNLSRQEIEQHLRDYLGVSDILWLGDGIAGDDTDGHIDDLARFVSERMVVTVVEENRDDENYEALQKNLAPPAGNENRAVARLKSSRSQCRRRSCARACGYRLAMRTSTSQILACLRRPSPILPMKSRSRSCANVFQSSRHRDRLPRTDLGPGRISLPHATTTGGMIGISVAL